MQMKWGIQSARLSVQGKTVNGGVWEVEPKKGQQGRAGGKSRGGGIHIGFLRCKSLGSAGDWRRVKPTHPGGREGSGHVYKLNKELGCRSTAFSIA